MKKKTENQSNKNLPEGEKNFAIPNEDVTSNNTNITNTTFLSGFKICLDSSSRIIGV